MCTSKKIINIARNLQGLDILKKKRSYLLLPQTKQRTSNDNERLCRSLSSSSLSSSSTMSIADKGHFVVYTADQRRFMIPLVYLNNEIFAELFKMSEEVFGLSCDGPITFPCDAHFMEYVISLVKRGGAAKELKKTLKLSVARRNLLSSTHCVHRCRT